MGQEFVDNFEWLIPAFSADAGTTVLTLNVHPGQIRILDHLVESGLFPFRNRDDAARLGLGLSGAMLLEGIPHQSWLIAARATVLDDEAFERQKHTLVDSVRKLIKSGQVDSAKRIINLSFGEYSAIPQAYWRAKWLSTVAAAVEALRSAGIQFEPFIPGSENRKSA